MGTRFSKHDFTCHSWVWYHSLLEKIPYFVKNHHGKLQTVQWRKRHHVARGENQDGRSNFIADLCNDVLLFQRLLLVFSQALINSTSYYVLWIIRLVLCTFVSNLTQKNNANTEKNIPSILAIIMSGAWHAFCFQKSA